MNNHKQNQSGNALIIVLVAVILFAALSFTVARSMRSESTNKLSQRELQLAAGDIIAYAQQIERAIGRMRRAGISENDISFENSTIAGYANANCTNSQCKIFDPDGGNISFHDADYFAPSLTNSFRFQANNRFATFGCETINDASCSDLVIELVLNDNPALCLAVNDLIGIQNPSDDAPRLKEWLSGGIFTGTFGTPTADLVGGSNATNEAPQVNGKAGGCVFEFNGGQNTYHFYYILLAR
ncbi:MAG: hypothetical protein KDI46_03790 [Alphaproteobacteria bacterium]|nr:hypothetical protein [Alphaproteobacteria bacterium]